MLDLINRELKEAESTLTKFLEDQTTLQQIQDAALKMSSTIQKGGKIISCGNGGSMCDAMHFAEELTGKFREDRSPFPAIAISDPSYLSCTANDYGYEQVFSRYIEGLGKEEDVILGISTSGNSENIIRAFQTARKKNIYTVALTGNNGGKLADLSDIEIRVPHYGFADRIQEIHIKVIHILILLIEEVTKK